MKTKIISLVLTVAVLLSCFATVIAAEGAGTPGFKIVGDPLNKTYDTLGAAIDAANGMAGDVTILMTGNTTSAAKREAKTTTKNITIDGQGYTFTNVARHDTKDEGNSIIKLGGTGSFTFTDITFDTTNGKHFFETDGTAVTLKFLDGVVFQNTGSKAMGMPAMILPKLAHVVIDGAVFKLNVPALAGWAASDFVKVEILSGTLSAGTYSSKTGVITTGYNNTCCMDVIIDVDNVDVYVNATTTRALAASDLAQIVDAEAYATAAVKGAVAKVEAFGYPYQSTNGDSTVTAYAELDAIYAFAPNNAVVNVVKNVDLTGASRWMSKLDTAKALTLKGKTGSEVITLRAGLAFAEISAGASLTIEDLAIKYDEAAATTAAYVFLLKGGKVTLGEGVLVKHADLTAIPGANAALNAAKVEADGSHIVVDGATIQTVGTTFLSDGFSSTIEIKSGSINAPYRFFVSNGAGKTVNLTISGGTINHTNAGQTFINTWSTGTENVKVTGGVINTAVTDAANTFKNVSASLEGGKLTIGGKVVYDSPAVEAVGSALYKNPTYPTDTAKGGIRFNSILDLNDLDASLIADKVTFGTVIALKADYEALADKTDLLTDLAKKINVKNTAGTAEDGKFSATLLGLSGNALNEELVGVPYVTIVVDGVGTYTYYGDAIVDAAANYDFFGLGA